MTDRSRPTWIPCAGAPADTVDRLYAGSLDGVVMKGLLSEEECTKCMTAVAA